MQRITFRNGAISMALGAGLCAVTPAWSMDPACQTVLAIQKSLRDKPFHVYMTSEDRFSAGKLSEAAAGMGMGGKKTSEEIWTGKDVYVLHGRTWIDMQTTYAEMTRDGANDPDIKKAHEAEQCAMLPDEMVFGQDAAVYRTRNPVLGVDGKVWVSKSSHLPLKAETTTDAGPMKSFASMRYEYTDVQAPANAMSMRDMMKKR